MGARTLGMVIVLVASIATPSPVNTVVVKNVIGYL